MVYQSSDIVERGKEIYETRLRSLVAEGNRGKFLVIDVQTGEYDLDADEMSALRSAKQRRKDAPLFVMRIGFATAHKMGGQLVSRVDAL